MENVCVIKINIMTEKTVVSTCFIKKKKFLSNLVNLFLLFKELKKSDGQPCVITHNCFDNIGQICLNGTCKCPVDNFFDGNKCGN